MDAPNRVTPEQRQAQVEEAIRRRLSWSPALTSLVNSDAIPDIAAAATWAWCSCDTNPATTEGPEEDCALHGRSIDDWIRMGRGNALIEVRDAIIAAAPRLNAELRYDGTEDPQMAAYVQGFHEAHDVVEALLRPPTMDGVAPTLDGFDG